VRKICLPAHKQNPRVGAGLWLIYGIATILPPSADSQNTTQVAMTDGVKPWSGLLHAATNTIKNSMLSHTSSESAAPGINRPAQKPTPATHKYAETNIPVIPVSG